MSAFLRGAGIAGLATLYVLLGAGPGSAQGGASPPPPAATPQTPPPSAADAAAAKANPDCKAPDIACAWSHCNPLASKWASYRACITDSCHVQQESCTSDLIIDLNDPDRQKAMGGG